MSEPDEAAVEAVAEVLAQNRNPFPLYPPTVMGLDRDEARLMLATPVVADAFRDAERLRAEVEVLEDDLLRVLQIRNAALLVAAEHIQPGPDGQDYIDREAMIREWVEEGHERVDDYRAEHQRLVLKAIDWRRDAERLRNLAARFEGHLNRGQTYTGAQIAVMLRGDGA